MIGFTMYGVHRAHDMPVCMIGYVDIVYCVFLHRRIV